MLPDRCPPHNFRAGWKDNEHGALWCSLCGEVRAFEPPDIEAPPGETLTFTANPSQSPTQSREE